MSRKYRYAALNSEKTVVHRFTGEYVDGIYQRTLSGVLEVWASIQPYKTIDPQDKFKPNAGSYVETRMYLYCDTLLYTDDNTQSNPVADQIIADGRTYKVASVENHNLGRSVTSHYRYGLELFDGY